MNCNVCSQPLPEGVTFCPNCGAPVERQSGSGQIDPTVLSAPPPYGTDPYAPPPPPNPYTEPAPNPYGATSYGSNPYGAPATGGVTPSQPAIYPAQPGVQPPPYAPAPKRRSRLGLILAIVAIVLILACGGIFFALYQVGKNTLSLVNATATAQANANATTIAQTNATATAQVNNINATATAAVNATTTPGAGTPPSGAAIDAAAAAIISHLQMASSIDSNDNPTQLANTFAVNQTIYATYNLNLQGQTGYIQAKWYVNNVFGASKIFNANNPTFTHGYFSETYKVAANGAVELYWCTKSDCSDAALASFVTFTVS